MAGEQRRLAHAAKRDSTSMKILSLLGAIFLPATYLASIFSMAFFDFIPDDNGAASSPASPSTPTTTAAADVTPVGGNNASGGWSPVSPLLWIYFAISVPLTIVIVVCWRLWDKRREVKYAKEDADIEAGIERMEAQIMATMRKRTLSKMRTWEVPKA